MCFKSEHCSYRSHDRECLLHNQHCTAHTSREWSWISGLCIPLKACLRISGLTHADANQRTRDNPPSTSNYREEVVSWGVCKGGSCEHSKQSRNQSDQQCASHHGNEKLDVQHKSIFLEVYHCLKSVFGCTCLTPTVHKPHLQRL